jgi:DNA polymerase V
MQTNMEPLADSNEDTGVSIHSGFPNPAADNHGRRSGLALDLNQLLVAHPSSTYLFRIRGEHWAGQGIFDGDIALIDRSLTAKPQDIVMTWEDETFALSRRHKLQTNQYVWGVVSAIIHPRA